MRKIKGFHLKPGEAEVFRRLKKRSSPASFSEEEVRQALTGEISKWVPALLYDSFPAGQDNPKLAGPPISLPALPRVPRSLEGLSPLPELPFTVGVVTLGAFAPETDETVLRIIRETALNEAVRFALKIVSEEAAQEQCDLSPVQYLSDSGSIQTLVESLDCSRIGVCWKPESGWSPAYTRAFAVSWIHSSRSSLKSSSESER